MYGFHKSRKDQTKSVFSHPLFKKTRLDLLPEIKTKIKLAEGLNSQNDTCIITPAKTIKMEKEGCETTATRHSIS